jgi:L-threonylcarbamoyladenylate synthase
LSASERRLRLGASRVTPATLAPAAAWLAHGGIVAYPTDTFYGLAVDPGSAEAVGHLFDLKGRDPSMAVPLIAASRDQTEHAFGTLAGASARLASAFWPGPLSLILDAPAWVTPAVHGGRGTVAVRVPDDAVACALAGAFGRPVTATSANRSGEPPAADAAALAWLDADPRVFVIDAGPTRGGAPSTLVDARGDEPVCVRAGAIAWERVLTSR